MHNQSIKCGMKIRNTSIFFLIKDPPNCHETIMLLVTGTSSFFFFFKRFILQHSCSVEPSFCMFAVCSGTFHWCCHNCDCSKSCCLFSNQGECVFTAGSSTTHYTQPLPGHAQNTVNVPLALIVFLTCQVLVKHCFGFRFMLVARHTKLTKMCTYKYRGVELKHADCFTLSLVLLRKQQ